AFERAEELAKGNGSREHRLDLALTRILLAEADDDRVKAIRLADGILAKVSHEDLTSHASLTRMVLAEVLEFDTDQAQKVLRVVGLGEPDLAAADALGRSLASWDEELSANGPDSSLGDRLRLPWARTNAPPRADWWQAWVRYEDSATLARCLAEVLPQAPPPLRATLLAALRGTQEESLADAYAAREADRQEVERWRQ